MQPQRPCTTARQRDGLVVVHDNITAEALAAEQEATVRPGGQGRTEHITPITAYEWLERGRRDERKGSRRRTGPDTAKMSSLFSNRVA